MDELTVLRRKAEFRRDKRISDAKKEIAAAEADFDEDIRHIEALSGLREVSAPGAKPQQQNAVMALIHDVLPPINVPITLDSMMDLLAVEHPNKEFNRSSIRALLHRLMKDGVLERSKRGSISKGDVATYYRAGSDLPTGPFGDATQIEIAEQVIREAGQPMHAKAVARRMIEQGYEPTNRDRLHQSLHTSMKRKPSVFRQSGDKWTVI